MTKRLMFATMFVLLLGLAMGTAIVSADPAVPTPPQTGCPAGYDHLSVEELEPQGYRVPRRVDEAGNNNGMVCGLAMPEAFKRQVCGSNCPVPVVYLFRDDNLPARR
jgi:hypothetical protein